MILPISCQYLLGQWMKISLGYSLVFKPNKQFIAIIIIRITAKYQDDQVVKMLDLKSNGQSYGFSILRININRYNVVGLNKDRVQTFWLLLVCFGSW